MSSIAVLAEAVDELQQLDLDRLTDAELEAAAVHVDRQLARLTAEHARLLAAVATRRSWAADGSKSCAAWLCRKRHGCRAAVSAALRLGESLASMPLVAAAVHAGDITVQHARLLASCRRFAPDEFPDAEELLLGYAKTLRWHAFVTVCARWRDVVDPDGAERKAEKVRERRHLILNRRSDGCVEFLSGILDPIAGAAFLDELERIERVLFQDDWAECKARLGAGVCTSKMRRTYDQRRVDALVEMAHRSRTAPADGRRPEPLVVVYVDYQTVTGRLCELASGVPITPGQLLPLFNQAEVERIVFGPGNRVIELGKRTRFFTGGLRRAILLRDRHCQFPGCTEPAARCEVHHERDYSLGGETTQENGRAYCGTHNRNKRRYERPEPDDLDDLDDVVEVDIGDEDDDDGPPESPEEIAQQVRRCRARLFEFARDDGVRPT